MRELPGDDDLRSEQDSVLNPDPTKAEESRKETHLE